MRKLTKAVATGALAVGATLSMAAPATAGPVAGASLAPAVVLEPITYVATQYIYPRTASGLRACNAYGPTAQRQYGGVSYQCRAVTIGSLRKYRIYVGTK